MLRQITIPKISGRVLDIHMSRPPVQTDGQGRRTQPEYDGREGRRWDRIITKILDAIKDYDDQVEELVAQARKVGLEEDFTQEEKDLKIARINEEIGELDDGIGQEYVTVVLESDEFKFIDDRWWDLHLPHDRVSRKKYTRPIDEALEPYNEVSNPHGWVEVRLEDGRVVHVERPAAPLAINGRPKQLQKTRR